jgi:hypothetical protein
MYAGMSAIAWKKKSTRNRCGRKCRAFPVPLRDCVRRRFDERMRRVVQTQSLQQSLFEKTSALKSQGVAPPVS